MKALILENEVVDTALVAFEVHSSLTWMDCSDDCVVGWSKIDGVLTAPPEPPEDTWDKKRQSEYPTIAELTISLFDAGDKAALVTKRAAVKKKWPKDNSGPIE